MIGQGYVGGSISTVFAERGETVYGFDSARKSAEGAITCFGDGVLPDGVRDFVRLCEGLEGFSGIFFVCVPTPMNADGTANISIVEQVLEDICRAPRDGRQADRIAVMKSTVPPGSCDAWNKQYGDGGLRVIFNPEFLTEANATNDLRRQDRIVLGGPRPYINDVRNLYRRFFTDVPIIKTSATTAEMVKYLTNCMLAVKVAFANEMAQICEALNSNGLEIDYDKVIEYATLDPRLGESHWAVPGPVPTSDGRYVRGFGGHCLPKDINALMRVAEQNGVDPKVMRAAWAKTLEVRGPRDRDWEFQVGQAVTEDTV